MRVEASHLLRKPGRRERHQLRLDLDVKMPLVTAGEARVDLWLEGGDDGIRIRGSIVAGCHLRCCRCLEPWEGESVVEVDRTVRRLPDSDGYSLPADGGLDLGGLVLDEVVLSLPNKPLCRRDCPGICPGCGTHLNSGACQCEEEDRESPFSVLTKFL